jgi:hypothetical protein
MRLARLARANRTLADVVAGVVGASIAIVVLLRATVSLSGTYRASAGAEEARGIALSGDARLRPGAASPDAVLRVLLARLRLTDRASADVIARIVGSPVAVVVAAGPAVTSRPKDFSLAVAEGAVDARLRAALTDPKVVGGPTGLSDPINAIAAFIGQAVTIAVIARHAGVGRLRTLCALTIAPIARCVAFSRDARSSPSTALPTAVEPQVLVTSLDGTG